MKKKQEVPKTPDIPASNIRSFFTKEINDQMAGMSVKVMETTLKQMVGTQEFIAILKYNSMRTPLLDMSLRGTNPVTDPHKISWSQGCMAGLNDLESYVIDLNAPKSPDEESEGDESVGGKPEGVIIG